MLTIGSSDARPAWEKIFYICFNAAMATICGTPEGFAKVLDDFRHIKVRRFPYAIYYEFQDGIVVVYAVFHAAQNPSRLKKTLWLRKPKN